MIEPSLTITMYIKQMKSDFQPTRPNGMLCFVTKLFVAALIFIRIHRREAFLIQLNLVWNDATFVNKIK